MVVGESEMIALFLSVVQEAKHNQGHPGQMSS
jgi:hypothetical protein